MQSQSELFWASLTTWLYVSFQSKIRFKLSVWFFSILVKEMLCNLLALPYGLGLNR